MIKTEDRLESIDHQLVEHYFAEGDDLSPELYPSSWHLSAAHFFQFLPRPSSEAPPEFVYIPTGTQEPKLTNSTAVEMENMVFEWNIAWETAQERPAFFSGLRRLPTSLRWLEKYEGQNIYLLPGQPCTRYYAYYPLFYMMPSTIVQEFGLPPLRRGLWPFLRRDWILEKFLPKHFTERLSKAFATFIWPLIKSGSPLSAFRRSDSLRLLAHNLDFWTPYAYEVTAQRAR